MPLRISVILLRDRQTDGQTYTDRQTDQAQVKTLPYAIKKIYMF